MLLAVPAAELLELSRVRLELLLMEAFGVLDILTPAPPQESKSKTLLSLLCLLCLVS